MAYGQKAKTDVLGANDTHIDIATVGDEIVSLPIAGLTVIVPEDFNKAGVVLVNARRKVMVDIGDGHYVTVTASLYVQRDAINEAEELKVKGIAAERKANADSKKREENERLASEKRAAFDLGQQSTLGMLNNVDQLARAASAIAKFTK